MGLARPRQAISRLRVRVPKRNIVPLSVNEVAHFWSSFRTSRDLAIVGLMLLHGLRSAEVLALNPVIGLETWRAEQPLTSKWLNQASRLFGLRS
jgi:integrase